jgi:hypothetical protein
MLRNGEQLLVRQLHCIWVVKEVIGPLFTYFKFPNWVSPMHIPYQLDTAQTFYCVMRSSSSCIVPDLFNINSAILRSLGVDNPELQLYHESFTTQWHDRNFRVKTFQEAYGRSGINVTKYSGKVIPDSSSSLGDTRERPESIAEYL